MALMKKEYVFQKFDQLEFGLCSHINNYSRKLPIRSFFRVVSRLGDGVFWYFLVLILPLLNGSNGVIQLFYVSLVGLVSVGLYKILKTTLIRERPYISFGSIIAQTKPIDRYSFPSGHSMNAACMAILLGTCEPLMVWLVASFATLVAMSRVILGMHYPSDVLMGLLLGSGVAYVGLGVLPFP